MLFGEFYHSRFHRLNTLHGSYCEYHFQHRLIGVNAYPRNDPIPVRPAMRLHTSRVDRSEYILEPIQVAAVEQRPIDAFSGKRGQSFTFVAVIVPELSTVTSHTDLSGADKNTE